MTPDARGCPGCGKRKRRYLTRRAAKQFAKRTARGEHLSQYRCGDFWHNGHLPEAVVNWGRDRDVVFGRSR